MTSVGARQEGVAWPDLAISRRTAGQPRRRLPAARTGPPEPHRPRRLPGHPPAHPRRPVHRRRLPPRRRPAAGARIGGGDRVRRRDRLAAAADAVRHRPGRAPARRRHRPGGRPARGRARTSRTTRSPWPCYAPAVPLPAEPVQPRGNLRRRCPARWQAPGPTCSCSPSCCPSRRPATRPRPAGSPLMASVTAPDSRGSVRLASASPADAAADRPRLPPRARRPGPAGSRAGHRPHRRGRRRVHPARRDRGLARPRVRDSGGLRDWIRRTVGSYYHPAGTCRIGQHPTTARSSTRTCGSTASPGCGSPTRR